MSVVRLAGDADSLINEIEEMAAELIKAHADIPGNTCPSIDAVLRDISDARKQADRIAARRDMENPELYDFASAVDTALWGLPDQLEALRRDNEKLREGIHYMGSLCHDMGRALKDFAYRIELTPPLGDE